MLTTHQAMDFEEVFQVLDTDVFTKTQRRLKDAERFVLWGAWRGHTYDEMAKFSDYRYTPSYLKQDIGPKLWKLLSKTLEEEVSKTNFRAALERRVQLQKSLEHQKQLNKQEFVENNPLKKSDSQDINQEIGNIEQLLILLDNERINKTVLTKSFEGQRQQELETAIWRSLLHTPPFENLLVELLQDLSYQQKTEPLEDWGTEQVPHSDTKFLQLIDRLRVLLQKFNFLP